MSPALNGSSALQHFEHGNVVEIHNGISTWDCHNYSHLLYTYTMTYEDSCCLALMHMFFAFLFFHFHRMYGLFQTVFYFGYMALASIALGILCGKKMYSRKWGKLVQAPYKHGCFVHIHVYAFLHAPFTIMRVW